MNIFILDNDPKVAAKYLCDKHLIKMILESAQLLCSPYHPGVAPYKRTHFNHPCSKWVRESEGNYRWLISHALSMCDEYTMFYKKTHKCEAVIKWCEDNIDKIKFIEKSMTPFAQAMPDQYKKTDAVAAYRDYYSKEKRSMAAWKNGRIPPRWWNE